MDLEQSVLDRIVPDAETVKSIKERAERLGSVTETYVKEHGIDAEVRFAGSFSKNTYLSDPDIDLFLMFPPETDAETLKSVSIQAGKDIIGGVTAYADHPYTRGTFEGLRVDLVPCYRLKSADNLLSAVDRTPFHTEFVKSRLDAAGCDQVRLLKAFMKGIGAYGANPEARGFSGYLCELLTIKYGTFRRVLEEASEFSEGTVIEIDGKGSKMRSALVIYDPVDVKRNAASAVHVDTLALFVHASREYLKKPGIQFFFPNERKPMSASEISEKIEKNGTRLVSISFDRPDSLEDTLQSQLWKTRYALEKKLNSFGFEVLRAVQSMDDCLTIVFEMERDALPKTIRHSGPPIWVNGQPFLEHWKSNPHGEPFIDGGMWNVIAETQYRDAVSMLYAETPSSGIGKNLDAETVLVLPHDEVLTKIDPLLLTELLDPKFPWEV